MAGWKGGESSKPKQPDWRGDSLRSPKHGWKKDDAPPPGTSRRKITAWLIGGLMLSVAVAIGIIWLLQKPTKQPCLVIFGNRPAEAAARLDVPMDLCGWLGGKLLIEQIKQCRERNENRTADYRAADDGTSPRAVPAGDGEIEEWVRTVEAKQCDPLVIYIGAHCGVSKDGPFIYSHNGSALPLRKFLSVLNSDPLKAKKKILLLDPHRRPQRFAEGQILGDFSAAVQDMNEEIKACENLMVILGCDKGERGWESEEKQASFLALALAKAFNGEESVTGENKVLDGKELFDYVREKVSNWTQTQRPGASTPVLLPREFDASTIDLGVSPSNPAEPRKTNEALDVNRLATAWGKRDALAATGSPQAYSPKLWRRYSEMLLRYDTAVRAGEPETANRLRQELDQCERTLDQRKRFLADWKSPEHSGGLKAALGQAALPPELLEEVIESKKLSAAEGLAKKYPAESRPMEIHLPVMVNQFYAKYAGNEAVAKEWYQAFDQRLKLERAAHPSPDGKPLYVERLRGLYEAVEDGGTKLEMLDELRREAEDKLFSDDPERRKQAAEALVKLNAGREKLEADAKRLHGLLKQRDRIFSDGPYLCEWYANRASPAEVAALATLWDDFHTAAAALDEGDASQADAKIDTLEKKLSSIASDLESVAKQAADFKDLQKNWDAARKAMESPVLPADQRLALLKAQRRIALKLLEGGDKQKTNIDNPGTTDSPAALQARLKLARALIGHETIARQSQSAGLAKPELFNAIDGKVFPAEKANELAQLLGAHLRAIDDAIALKQLDPVAERHSRLGCAKRSDEPLEPATVNLRLRWIALLRSQAKRTALDRWREESESRKAWFRDVANEYLADAKRVSESLGLPDDRTAVEKLLAEAVLSVKSDPMKIEGWTSQPKQSLTFWLTAPKEFPSRGFAVGFSSEQDVLPLKLTRSESKWMRPLVDVAASLEDKLPSWTLDASAVEERNYPEKQAKATFYFRGEVATGQVAVNISRKADLVVVEGKPADDVSSVKIAVMAANNLEVGEVVILLDYSGSMNWGIDGTESVPVSESRKTKALEALKKILLKLPHGMPLKIYLFHKRTKNSSGTLEEVKIGGLELSKVTWKDEDGARTNLNSVMDYLGGITPSGFTPLVESIGKIMESKSFSDLKRRKLFVVLTDGIDQTTESDDDIYKPDVIDPKQKILKELFAKYTDRKLLVFLFAGGDKANEASKRLFLNVGADDNVAELQMTNESNQLENKVLDAIYDRRIRVLGEQGTPPGWTVKGMAVKKHLSFKKKDDLTYLEWSPTLPCEKTSTYDLIPLPAGTAESQKLAAASGDRVYLEMTTVNGKTVLRRGSIANVLDGHVYSQDRNWILAPELFGINVNSNHSLHGYLRLEKVPEHLRGQEDHFEPEIRWPSPGRYGEFVWWEATPADLKEKEPKPAVRLERFYGTNTPTWKITSAEWPKSAERVYRPLEMDVIVNPKPVVIEKVEMPFSQEIKFPNYPKLSMTCESEPHPFSPKDGKLYLVVRVQHGEHGPVYLKLVTPADCIRVEHRYYKDAKSCTAIFGPFEENDLRIVPKFDIVLVNPSIQAATASILKLKTGLLDPREPIQPDLLRK